MAITDKVFILGVYYYGDGFDGEIGVFTTRELAEEARDKYEKENGTLETGTGRIKITEFPLNEYDPLPV